MKHISSAVPERKHTRVMNVSSNIAKGAFPSGRSAAAMCATIVAGNATRVDVSAMMTMPKNTLSLAAMTVKCVFASSAITRMTLANIVNHVSIFFDAKRRNAAPHSTL
jgi:hypothetical protein